MGCSCGKNKGTTQINKAKIDSGNGTGTSALNNHPQDEEVTRVVVNRELKKKEAQVEVLTRKYERLNEVNQSSFCLTDFRSRISWSKKARMTDLKS